jgi:hypothetical protein
VVQHGVAEDEVERLVVEGQPLRLAAHGLHIDAEPGGGVRQHLEHPG